MKHLNLKQIEKYHKNGFIIVKNVFTRKECENLKKILLEEINKGKDILQKFSSEIVKKIDTNKIADIPRMINEGMLQDIAHRNSKFMSLAKDNRLITIISQLFGNEIKAYRLYRSLSVFKNASITSKSELHQDMKYWKGKTNKLSIWIALSKVTKQSGSLIFYPGTHDKIRKHTMNKKKNEGIFMRIEGLDNSQKVIAEMDIGDIIAFHSCVVHGSEENIMREERYALTFTYQPAIDHSHHRSGPAELIEQRLENR